MIRNGKLTIEPTTQWAVHDWRGNIWPFTISRTRGDAIKSVLRLYSPTYTGAKWRHHYLRGCRTIRVEIRAVRKSR